MTLAARILIGLVALFFLILAFRFYFMPHAAAVDFFIAPQGTSGMSTVRGDLGGAFFATGAFALLGLRRGATNWLHAAAAILAATAMGRVIGFVIDGVAQSAVVGITIEIICIAILVSGARALRRVAITIPTSESTRADDALFDQRIDLRDVRPISVSTSRVCAPIDGARLGVRCG